MGPHGPPYISMHRPGRSSLWCRPINFLYGTHHQFGYLKQPPNPTLVCLLLHPCHRPRSVLTHFCVKRSLPSYCGTRLSLLQPPPSCGPQACFLEQHRTSLFSFISSGDSSCIPQVLQTDITPSVCASKYLHVETRNELWVPSSIFFF